MEWKVEIDFHANGIAAMPDGMVHGRSAKEGYIRACGLQLGNVIELCCADPLFGRAYELARGRTVVTDERLVNLFMLIKFFLPRLPFGHIVEFGSFRGGSAIFMAMVADALCPGMKVYAFDTFEAMPPTDTQRNVHRAGDFAEASLEEIRQCTRDAGVNNLELVKGLLRDTIPAVVPSIGGLRLAHIDCDLFEGVATSYDGCKPYMMPGGYLVFDDPLESSCLGAFEAVENLVIRRDGLHAEQVYPHLVYRIPTEAKQTIVLACA